MIAIPFNFALKICFKVLLKLKLAVVCLCLFAFFLISCNSNSSKQEEKKQENITEKIEDPLQKQKALQQLDGLEKLFNNNNYLYINKQDSNYIYFSRLGSASFYTHSYNLKQGDSANLKIDTIFINQSNEVQWNFKGTSFILTNTPGFTAIFKVRGKDSVAYTFSSLDENTIEWKTHNQRVQLKKMLPLSLFLTRSFYDYTHHTHFAFDTTTNFKAKK